ncbi:MAG TPA: hypothetical protein VK790_09370 [Solirubrobacteraceae bacterium]|jgi:hypothetical protein|nr:hypothetical protein [Solirubrobacteraceae bacterium]
MDAEIEYLEHAEHAVGEPARRGHRTAAGGGRVSAALGAAAMLCALVAAVAPAPALGAGSTGPASGANPLTVFTSGHPYRHGVVPTVSWMRTHRTRLKAYSEGSGPLYYRGGIDSVGVTSGPPRVYVILWGSQWGTEGTNGGGFKTFSGDPNGMAPDIQAFFAGLGSEAEGERWSGVTTQYCEGVSVGATECPANVPHVGFPSGGVLDGVWEDTSQAAPAEATGHQIAEEAVRAAEHFGNESASSNRYVQYDIISPTGTNPDGYKTGGFCAWHDYTGDTTLDGGGAAATSWGDPVAFTNMPYIPDAGESCGAEVVNAGSALDGVTIVGGHEYAETLTDQYPLGGWTDSEGFEVADKCAWIRSGQGAMQDIALATGSFPVQSMWANDYEGVGGCEISHPIVTGGENYSLVFTGETTSTSPGAPLEVTVAVENESGEVQSSGERSADSLELSVASGPQATFSSCGANPVSASEGVAHFTCALAAAGTYTLSASDLSEPAVSFPTDPLEVEVTGLPIAASGWEVHMFADGFYNLPHPTNQFYLGPIGIVSDASNNLYIGDAPNGLVYKFGPAGGLAGPASVLSLSSIGYWPLGLSFGKDGALYAVMDGEDKVVQLNPATGEVVRVVANVEEPLGIATDPVSGDLFVTSDGLSPGIWRISNPSSATPTASLYAGGMDAPDGISAGPDGTFYVEDDGTIYSVAGTASASPGTESVLGYVSGADGVGVGANPFDPAAPSYVVVNSNYGELVQVPLGAGETTTSPIFTGGTRGDFVTVAPDGCLYATQSNSVLRVSGSGEACPFAPITPFQPPAVEAPAAPGLVSETSADFKALVDPQGTATTFHFQYGTTTRYGEETPEAEAGSANEAITISQEVSGLAPATTYHYRVVAHNEAGTVYGPDSSLSTASPQPAPPPPKATEAPTISGQALPGHTLRCSEGHWEGTSIVKLSWLRDGSATVGQGSTYQVQNSDAGHSLTCVAHAEGPGGSASADSASVIVHVTARTFRVTLHAGGATIARLLAHGVVVSIGVPQSCKVSLRLIAVRVVHGRPVVKLLAAQLVGFRTAGHTRVLLRVARSRLTRLGHGYVLRITASALSGSEHSQPASLTLGR